MRRPLWERVAGAPITWGVCEVPGWGSQLSPERVLSEMAALGLRATELGPDGYLPTDPEALRALLAAHGLELVGGFVPAVLHREGNQQAGLAGVSRSADTLAAGGASVLVLAADSPEAGYERTAPMDDDQWKTLVRSIDRVMDIGRERGLTVAFHPHVGTVVEGPVDVVRLLDSSPVELCLDTGHLAVGGSDPLELARSAAGRVAHVHLKDVAMDVAERVRGGRLGYADAVRAGMYRPLGAGDLPMGDVVAALEDAGYAGWYVLEQDTVLAELPSEGRGPYADAAASVGFLRQLAAGVGRAGLSVTRPRSEGGAGSAALTEKGGRV
jgi:inosose dehydratase